MRSAYDYEIPAHGKMIAKTDLQILVPDGTYGRIAPRSGLAAKNFIDIGAGVVDQDYRYHNSFMFMAFLALTRIPISQCSNRNYILNFL